MRSGRQRACSDTPWQGTAPSNRRDSRPSSHPNRDSSTHHTLHTSEKYNSAPPHVKDKHPNEPIHAFEVGQSSQEKIVKRGILPKIRRETRRRGVIIEPDQLHIALLHSFLIERYTLSSFCVPRRGEMSTSFSIWWAFTKSMFSVEHASSRMVTTLGYRKIQKMISAFCTKMPIGEFT